VMPSSDETMQPFKKWNLGDLVTVVVGGQEVPAVVSAMALSVAADGVRVMATVGQPTGISYEALVARKSASNAKRVNALDRKEAVSVAGPTGPAGPTGATGDTGPAGSGTIVQVVTGTYGTQVSSSGGNWVSTGLAATITPKSSTSRILIMATTNGVNARADIAGSWSIFRGGTNLGGGTKSAMAREYTAGGQLRVPVSLQFTDSPNSTNGISYSLRMNCDNGANTIFAQHENATASIVLMEIS
jgi:hypothetical protein